MKEIKTPCIGVCSTGIGDSVCRGCKRFSNEVIQWNAYSDNEKLAILGRIDSLTEQIVSHRVDVFDQALLQQQLDLQGLRYDKRMSMYSWVFDLLKGGAGQISSLEAFGCRLRGGWQHISLHELKQHIDESIFILSTVHHERYFSQPA